MSDAIDARTQFHLEILLGHCVWMGVSSPPIMWRLSMRVPVERCRVCELSPAKTRIRASRRFLICVLADAGPEKQSGESSNVSFLHLTARFCDSLHRWCFVNLWISFLARSCCSALRGWISLSGIIHRLCFPWNIIEGVFVRGDATVFSLIRSPLRSTARLCAIIRCWRPEERCISLPKVTTAVTRPDTGFWLKFGLFDGNKGRFV